MNERTPRHPAVLLTEQLVRSRTPEATPFEIRDTKLSGLILRVQPSGRKSYILQYGRGKRVSIGRADVLSPTAARKMARVLLGEAEKGKDLQEERKSKKRALQQKKDEAKRAITFLEFLDRDYIDDFDSTNKAYGETEAKRIKSRFPMLLPLRLIEINPWLVRKWKAKRTKDGISPQTINRDIAALKGALSRAINLELLEAHPLKSIKLTRTDLNAKPRYLSVAERKCLLDALDVYDAEARRRLVKSDKPEFLNRSKKPFANKLKPMVLVAMHTGIRRGELFGLTWGNVNQDTRLLTVEGATSKRKTTRHIPLNPTALAALAGWKKSCGTVSNDRFVFPGNDRLSKLNNIKKSWTTLRQKAKLSNFRWHDLRHDFASRLVQEGVDLNIVRELLGHSDIKMTLRYAHLDPRNMANAVARIAEKQ